MENFVFEQGTQYRHFKGDTVTVICLAQHSETDETLVIYEHKGRRWARPLEMFCSEVDREKYPNASQRYRFELEK